MTVTHKIVKTTSHRLRDNLLRSAPGTVGPYWVGRHRDNPSIFDRVNAEFWLVPVAECTRLVTGMRGINFPVQIEVADLHPWGGWGSTSKPAPDPVILCRLEHLRGELRAERLSYSELADLQGLAEHINPGDVELLEAAGVPEFEPWREHSPVDWYTIGKYPSCSCGETPNDNRALIDHWAENGVRWIANGGTLEHYPIKAPA